MEPRRVAERVDVDIDDVLATLPLVHDNGRLTDRLFDQLVDLLLESSLLDLRARLLEGDLSAADYGHELAELARQCRTVGLLTEV